MTISPDVLGTSLALQRRKEKLGQIYLMGDSNYTESPFFTQESTRSIMDGTQFDGEEHRKITPYVQDAWEKGVGGKDLLGYIDTRVRTNSTEILSTLNNYDVAIIGSGPHGTAVAAYLAEKRPELSVVIIESRPQLGGMWRSYGPKPVFQMNSRVRRADRRLPPLPRTPANINPLGMYAPVELSDIPTGAYAWNTEMGAVCTINAFLSADTLVDATVSLVEPDYNEPLIAGSYPRIMTLETAGGSKRLRAKIVVDARGLRRRSAIGAFSPESLPDGFFNTDTFYTHFATHPNPLERFHGQRVAVIGRGDGGLTVLEALIGNLPASTYGHGGVGRMRPSQVDWYGAASAQVTEIEACLRSRYKNGIVQSLKRDGNDECGLIKPMPVTVSTVRQYSDRFFDLADSNGGVEFPTVVIDCTSIAGIGNRVEANWEPNYFVGPSTGNFSDRTSKKIDELKIPENNISLWATMQWADDVGKKIATDLPVAKTTSVTFEDGPF